ncbi:hypothetical protein CRENBAI_015540 [Crenichthys baileyi]|uniref:Uncharacterized protein n=1 Tax=Crenichthys baileyi TaxID=28760 RepID=A0AAV9SD30_9TELE
MLVPAGRGLSPRPKHGGQEQQAHLGRKKHTEGREHVSIRPEGQCAQALAPLVQTRHEKIGSMVSLSHDSGARVTQKSRDEQRDGKDGRDHDNDNDEGYQEKVEVEKKRKKDERYEGEDDRDHDERECKETE